MQHEVNDQMPKGTISVRNADYRWTVDNTVEQKQAEKVTMANSSTVRATEQGNSIPKAQI